MEKSLVSLASSATFLKNRILSMDNMSVERKLKAYYFTAIISLLFAVIGFSYNAWRMELSEDNSNIRTASFEVLKELAELERVIFAAHYDKDPIEGNPRKGWVKVGLITDLSTLISDEVEGKASSLKNTWSGSWESMAESKQTTENLLAAVDDVRMEIKENNT